MRPLALALVLLLLSALPAVAQDEVRLDDSNSATIPVPTLGGWVLSPDGETLIVSSPQTAEIIYINTSEDKELKRVKVDFQPSALALRGPSLYAVGKGSSLLYILDAKTGKQRKEIRVPGTSSRLACHPTDGPLFATTDAFDVVAINTESGKTTKTGALGNFLAIDPNGDFLYTGTQKPIQESLVLSRASANSVRLNVAHTNINSATMKYRLKGKAMKPLAMNGYAGINGRALVVSPDGKKIAMVGGGGLQSEDGRRTYAIAVFDTSDLKTQLGQVETGAYPSDIGFHPALDLGAAEKSGGLLILFNTRSLAPLRSMQVATRSMVISEFKLLTFGGRGTKLVYYHAGEKLPIRDSRNRPKLATEPSSPGQLYLIPLELTDDQKAEMAKAYPVVKD